MDKDCTNCDGEGKYPVSYNDPGASDGYGEDMITCHVCGGSGKLTCNS